MTQEERQLLLQDLAARIPYKVIGQVTFNRFPKQPSKEVIDGDLYDRFARAQDDWYDNVQIIPYLRPMSKVSELINAKELSMLSGYKLIDWYNTNHIDYRGLIEKGLVLVAFINYDAGSERYLFQAVCLASKRIGSYGFSSRGICYLSIEPDIDYPFEEMCEANGVEYVEPNKSIK